MEAKIMKIAGSSITMSTQRRYTEEYSKEESLRIRVAKRREEQAPTPAQKDSLLILPKETPTTVHRKKCRPTPTASEDLLSPREKQKLLILEKILSALTGKKVKIKVLSPPHTNQRHALLEIPSKEPPNSQAPSQGWGVEYDLQESYKETEKLSFSAQGVIRTDDGIEIEFNTSLTLSREFAMENRISFKAGETTVVDPLVINYNGSAAELTTTEFFFDLDNDGKPDQIPFFHPGSGVLALDKNNDGVINNGSELFGPTTGDGFSELAAYDLDQNNWLDDHDPIFANLRIWTKDEDGIDQLFALGAKGIGAIYLGNIEALFNYKDEENQLQGQNQKIGLFLKEDGAVGAIQQVNLKI